MIPPVLSSLIQVFIFPGFIFILSYAMFCEWVSRKFVARLQNRVGPLYTGWEGILQPLADSIKLLAKEDITPKAADKFVFALMPVAVFALPLTAIFLIPIQSLTNLWGYSPIVSFEGDLIIVLFLLSVIILSIFLAGWSSANRFGIIGATRAALQMLAYEIPLGIAMIGPAIFARSLSIGKIVEWQAQSMHNFLSAPNLMAIPVALLLAVGFIICTVCLLAELELRPFDSPEAETEIVHGWQVEYSGKKLGLLRLGHDVKLVLASALLTSLFLGGPIGPWPIPPVVWFLLKTAVCVLILSNASALFARLRIDQMLGGSWRYLAPLSILYIMAVQIIAGLM
ncbi:MAG: NADH-quinone oxidoreductase subunit H [Candidatus Bathyarchaeota archaeon]|nr:NADH-quinone oxidoreductase subunit H [Candidatus Bathyarchaeota archaeon]